MSVLMWSLFFCSSIVIISACGGLKKIIVLGGKYEFIDLAFPVDKKVVNNYDGNNTRWSSYENATQFVAPAEYVDRGANIGEISEEKLIVQLFLFNLSSKVKENPSYTLRMNDVEQLLYSDMLLQLGSWPTLIVFDFGWSKFYAEFKTYPYYSKGNFSHPAISKDVTDWLTKNESTKLVVGVGTDLPSIDGADKTLARAGIYVIERLNLTVNLPAHECITVVSPLKIEAASRVPTNIVAICPKDSVQENHANTEHGHSKDRKKHARSKRHTCGCHMHEHAHPKHGKEDKTDQTQPTTESSNTSANLPQQIIDGIKSIKNTVKIPGLNSQ